MSNTVAEAWQIISNYTKYPHLFDEMLIYKILVFDLPFMNDKVFEQFTNFFIKLLANNEKYANELFVTNLSLQRKMCLYKLTFGCEPESLDYAIEYYMKQDNYEYIFSDTTVFRIENIIEVAQENLNENVVYKILKHAPFHRLIDIFLLQNGKCILYSSDTQKMIQLMIYRNICFAMIQKYQTYEYVLENELMGPEYDQLIIDNIHTLNYSVIMKYMKQFVIRKIDKIVMSKLKGGQHVMNFVIFYPEYSDLLIDDEFVTKHIQVFVNHWPKYIYIFLKYEEKLLDALHTYLMIREDSYQKLVHLQIIFKSFDHPKFKSMIQDYVRQHVQDYLEDNLISNCFEFIHNYKNFLTHEIFYNLLEIIIEKASIELERIQKIIQEYVRSNVNEPWPSYINQASSIYYTYSIADEYLDALLCIRDVYSWIANYEERQVRNVFMKKLVHKYLKELQQEIEHVCAQNTIDISMYPIQFEVMNYETSNEYLNSLLQQRFESTRQLYIDSNKFDFS